MTHIIFILSPGNFHRRLFWRTMYSLVKKFSAFNYLLVFYVEKEKKRQKKKEELGIVFPELNEPFSGYGIKGDLELFRLIRASRYRRKRARSR